MERIRWAELKGDGLVTPVVGNKKKIGRKKEDRETIKHRKLKMCSCK